jgi:hypothetical protein
MWTPEGRETSAEALPSLAPTEVLFEYEEPLTFVCPDRDGQWLLAHSLGAEAGTLRYLVAATDERILGDLKAGRVDILGALRQPRCWVADVGPGWAVKRLWIIPFAKVPPDALPRPGVLLTPELEGAIEPSGTGTRG